KTLNLTRIFVREQRFRIAVCFMKKTMPVDQVGKAFAALADAMIEVLYKAVLKALTERYGTSAAQNFMIIGMGSLGCFEMTIASDLDLMMIYDGMIHFENAVDDDSISASSFFTKVGQRLLTA